MIRPQIVMGMKGDRSPRNLAPATPPHLLVHALVLLAARAGPRERVHLALRLPRWARKRRLRAAVHPEHRLVHLLHLLEAALAIVVADVVYLQRLQLDGYLCRRRGTHVYGHARGVDAHPGGCLYLRFARGSRCAW